MNVHYNVYMFPAITNAGYAFFAMIDIFIAA